MNYKIKDKCRCCLSDNLTKYLNLTPQPLANSYHRNQNLVLDKYPMEVMICLKCFHSQLSIVVDPKTMYENYLYVSGTTRTLDNHFKELSKYCINKFTNIPTYMLRVLDIASNDGLLLEKFRNVGCTQILGVDPAKNLREISKSKNINTIVDFWSRRLALTKLPHQEYNIITVCNCFGHVDDLDDFLAGCYQALSGAGILVIEVPYGVKTLQEKEYSQMYHEHLSYFLVNSLSILLERHNMYIYDVMERDIHGGSLRITIRKGISNHCKKAREFIFKEESLGLFSLETYQEYEANILTNNYLLKEAIDNLRRDGYKIVGYGAAAKATVCISKTNIDVDYIVDDNELKVGYFLPAKNIPIKHSSLLRKEENKLAIIVFSWNFLKEIRERIVNICGDKAKQHITIIDTPEIKVDNF